MPSSYTSSARFTLQATGENNNTWGVILNSGVFQLVDDTVNGRLALALSGVHALTVNLGATDEARMAFIDVTGGSGGTITAPSVPKGYFVHNGAAGVVNLSAGGALLAINPGDAGPVFTDGTTFYPVLIGGLTIKGYTDGQVAILKAYVDAQIAGSIINMPPVTGQAGKLLTNDGANAFWTATLATFTITTSLTVPTKAPHDNSQNAASTAYADAAILAALPAGIGGAYAFRNRIINGAMAVDQRHAGGGLNLTAGQYVIDRWMVDCSKSTWITAGQNLVGAPLPVGQGFTKYLGLSSAVAGVPAATDVFAIHQTIEGLNISDLMFGSPQAKSVTLSFWVQSHVTGLFGGSLRSGGAPLRSYPFTFNISVADTWTFITIPIPGDTTGASASWLTDNSAGLTVYFSVGSGSNFAGPAGAWATANYVTATGCASIFGALNNSFLLTGVQLEVGSVASAFERRLFAVELQLCQRYYENSFNYGIAPADAVQDLRFIGAAYIATNALVYTPFKVPKRAAPTQKYYSSTAIAIGSGLWAVLGPGAWFASTFTGDAGANTTNTLTTNVGAAMTAGMAYTFGGGWAADAEL